ncbi:trypsin-like peptidase domain-containing protein [Verrucomicrobiaceae bacterium 227]
MILRNGALILMLGFPVMLPADPLAFNEKEVPETLGDFREIQDALQAHLERARSATICLQMGEGSGSGVIVSADGLVLTAAHVTAGVGTEMTVVMEDGTEYQGVSLGLQSETDAAMLQITDEGPFPYVEYDKEDSTKLGDWVFSLGHSGGFDKARGVNVRVGRLVREAETTIQSDCMLIGGDSGGPLFNMRGELIGIHSRVGSSKEESMHVPLREFQKNWDEMSAKKFIGEGPFAKKSQPGTGFLGVITEPAEEGGLRVVEVWEDGIAGEAGIKAGDRILEIEGEAATGEILNQRLAELGVGDRLKLKWISGEETKEETLKLGERP